ncbi:MAG TPA: hypothetical protein VHQ45_12625, partial [Gemmatimonadaceae bacterium]|nr:hypothetical protein [Gemmatimonadaceae bacterium]
MQRFWSNRGGRPAAVLAGAVTLLLAGCGNGSTALESIRHWHRGPFVSGRVERRPVSNDDWGYLVLAPTAPGADAVGAYFQVGSGTR